MKKNLLLILTILLTISCKDNIIKPGAELQLLADGFKFTEGPAKSPDGHIYFTDQPNNQILKWDIEKEKISVFKAGEGRSNGMYFDNDGYLISCADEKNEMWRFDMKGEHTVLFDSYNDNLLNAPNDLWIDELGGIYFTDPLYKRPWWEHRPDTMYQDGMHVYYFSPDGEMTRVIDDFVKPNGIIGDIERGELYVADLGDKKIWKYTIDSPGVLSHKTLFAPMGSDGMTIDKKRNVYLTNDNGVYVYNQKSEQVAFIEVPQRWAANATIGGKENKTLYITSISGFYSIELCNEGLY